MAAGKISGLMLGVAMAALGAALTGCETIQLGPEVQGPSDTSTATTASLTLINQRQTDPGALVFLLYGPTVQDIENVSPSVSLDPVDFEKSLTVQVKPGRWKVAYRLESGDLFPMPSSIDEEGTQEDWPVVSLAKGKSYTILIGTNDGGITTWRTNLPVVD